jgi:hypothetical protein
VIPVTLWRGGSAWWVVLVGLIEGLKLGGAVEVCGEFCRKRLCDDFSELSSHIFTHGPHATDVRHADMEFGDLFHVRLTARTVGFWAFQRVITGASATKVVSVQTPEISAEPPSPQQEIG